MTQKPNNKKQTLIIKFGVPYALRQKLSEIAIERNISLSALLRLISSEYTHNNKLR